jgi:hypothetical protein
MDETHDKISIAPLPTTKTLRQRTSLPLQLWRFAWINVRMIRMVFKADH